jgi:hypothetical protein
MSCLLMACKQQSTAAASARQRLDVTSKWGFCAEQGVGPNVGGMRVSGLDQLECELRLGAWVKKSS